MISFIYFDVGGVVIKDFSDSNKWEALLTDLKVDPTYWPLVDTKWHDYNDEICLHRDVDTLIPLFTQHFHATLPPHYSMLQDFVNRFETNPSIWPIIKNIHKTCQIGLLTNMYPRMFATIQKAHLFP